MWLQGNLTLVLLQNLFLVYSSSSQTISRLSFDLPSIVCKSHPHLFIEHFSLFAVPCAMDTSDLEKQYVSGDCGGSNNTSENGSGPDAIHVSDPIDRAAEKRLIRKCDLHVIPAIALLYSLAFIDRINIGNARIQGLEKDLHMKGNDYNIALFIFFIPYILCEVPANIIIRKISPSTWLSSIMILWGAKTRTLWPMYLSNHKVKVS